MLLWIVLAVAAVIVVLALFTYNGLVGKRNQVRNAWAQIDVQLKRRHDLVPNLVNAVQGALRHEREVLERVVQCRAQAISAGANVRARAEAENQLTQAMRSLFAVAEAYPTLRANDNVRALQEELASTENRVAYARQFYNDSVMEYNTARESLPASLFAPALGFSAAPHFEVTDPVERAVPQVRL